MSYSKAERKKESEQGKEKIKKGTRNMCISVELELGGIVSYVTRFDKQKKRIQEACKRGKKGDGRYVYIRLACCVCLCVCASLFAVCIYIL